MWNHKRDKMEVDRTKEARTKEISRMIDEGGLGSDKYYDIKKGTKSSDKHNDTHNQ